MYTSNSRDFFTQQDLDHIAADPCHINADTPRLKESAARDVADWTTTVAQDTWSTATNKQAMKQIAIGTVNQIKHHPIQTAGAVGKGLVISSTKIVGRVPMAGYLIGREGAMLALKGPDAAADDTIKVVASPLIEAAKVVTSAQALSNPDSTKAQKAAAKNDLQHAGADVTTFAATKFGEHL